MMLLERGEFPTDVPGLQLPVFLRVRGGKGAFAVILLERLGVSASARSRCRLGLC